MLKRINQLNQRHRKKPIWRYW